MTIYHEAGAIPSESDLTLMTCWIHASNCCMQEQLKTTQAPADAAMLGLAATSFARCCWFSEVAPTDHLPPSMLVSEARMDSVPRQGAPSILPGLSGGRNQMLTNCSVSRRIHFSCQMQGIRGGKICIGWRDSKNDGIVTLQQPQCAMSAELPSCHHD